MAKELFFKPFPLLSNPHLQTVFGSLLNGMLRQPPSTRKLISLPDGDQISLEVTTPPSWTRTDLTVVLIHGLCGSHESTYVVRMVELLSQQQIRAVRVNMRGCGSGRGLAKNFYHSGRSEDVLAALNALKETDPLSPIMLVGYSLGANIVLKLSGELGEKGRDLLQQVIAISPPADLYASVQRFDGPSNAIYKFRFAQKLREHVCELHKIFCPDEPPLEVPRDLKMREFDEMFTAPRCGYKDALDYYTKCSAAPLVPSIAIPCKILLAEDDPLVSPTSLDELELPDNVEVFKTKQGGHLGYLGHPMYKGGFRWLDSLVLDWIREY
jgi:predicted alpha/beta-fold hydrolase